VCVCVCIYIGIPCTAAAVGAGDMLVLHMINGCYHLQGGGIGV